MGTEADKVVTYSMIPFQHLRPLNSFYLDLLTSHPDPQPWLEHTDPPVLNLKAQVHIVAANNTFGFQRVQIPTKWDICNLEQSSVL